MLKKINVRVPMISEKAVVRIRLGTGVEDESGGGARVLSRVTFADNCEVVWTTQVRGPVSPPGGIPRPRPFDTYHAAMSFWIAECERDRDGERETAAEEWASCVALRWGTATWTDNATRITFSPIPIMRFHGEDATEAVVTALAAYPGRCPGLKGYGGEAVPSGNTIVFPEGTLVLSGEAAGHVEKIVSGWTRWAR